GANNLARLNVAFEHQPCRGGHDVEPRITSQQFPILGLRDLNARYSRIARGSEAIDIGLADEAAVHQLQCAVEIGLGEFGIGARNFDLRRRALRLLSLDRAVDNEQRLTCPNPIARSEEHTSE